MPLQHPRLDDIESHPVFPREGSHLFAQRPHAGGSARVALGLGDLSAMYGDPEGARREYERALELAALADHSGLQIAALERLGTLLAAQEPETVARNADRAAALRAEAFGAAPPAT